MPTIASGRYPKPNSWDEFEDICKDSFELKWGVNNLNRHGRQGQSQHGVDIYGYVFNSGYYGIQCKNTTNEITKKLIEDECLKAEGFKPELVKYFIATTADRDIKSQKIVRDINEERRLINKFPVEILFWDDIIQDLSKSEIVFQKHYPQFKLSSGDSRDDVLLEKYCDIFDFDYSQRLRNAIFGKQVPRDLVERIFDYYHAIKEDPDWHFNDEGLEERRKNLLNSMREFSNHFAEQSAGMMDYYDFVDLHKCFELGEEVYNRNLAYVNEMQNRSFNLSEKFMGFLHEKKIREL